ncbi:TPM domain-containing protein [Lactobacillus rodentium]|uniref:TPM domain-containing protein n=1 Tax=Lactobacillus rodentium TaxID=947835 RepID=A0A2Z6T8X6_9LACO|nr:TPM domain-containing protein [Lactobacillus rodentium]MCR1894598.1 TPM domain-containing protein [Lactobacillus rodentium]GBG04928.1 hypothetical protein LrDSM24759_08420 [Lactobacillus rodentium]
MEINVNAKRSILLMNLVVAFLITLSCFSVFNSTVNADNKDVQDNAQVLMEETQAHIKQVNDNELSKIDGHPQIAVITQEHLNGEDLDQRAQDLFDKYKFGRKGYDNGILFLIITGDHKMRMQTGYGVESAVPDTFINELVAGETKEDLQAGDYNDAVTAIVDKTAKRLADHEDELLDKGEVAQEEKAHPHKTSIFSSISKFFRNNIVNKIPDTLIVIGLIILGIWAFKDELLVILAALGLLIASPYFIVHGHKLKKAIRAEAANLSQRDLKNMLNEADEADIKIEQVPTFVKFFKYNKEIRGKTLPWSSELLDEISNMDLDEYKKLTERYNQTFEAGRKIENWSEDDFLKYLGTTAVTASIGALLAKDFDPEKLGKKWDEDVHKAYKRSVEQASRDNDSWFFDSDSGGSSDFGGDGGSSGGGGGDASW